MILFRRALVHLRLENLFGLPERGNLLDPAARPARKAAPKAVVSTMRGRSMGLRRISAWNCMRKSLTEAPPSTRRTESVRPESSSMASSRSFTW
jgi:hypothetical protein